jgi:hypothetical protein
VQATANAIDVLDFMNCLLCGHIHIRSVGHGSPSARRAPHGAKRSYLRIDLQPSKARISATSAFAGRPDQARAWALLDHPN